MKLLLIIPFWFALTFGRAANCERIVPFILTWEGGYAKLPNDPGGETNKGVTWATWKAFYGNTHAEFMAMPVAKWMHIFKVGYWDKMRADDIHSQRIAETLAEWCWCSGQLIPARSVQRVLKIPADGKIGATTVSAINKANERWLYKELITSRFRFISRIPYYQATNWLFEEGWMSRMNEFVFFQNGL